MTTTSTTHTTDTTGAPTPGVPIPATRIGGHLVAESLAALEVDVAFGVPGIHALAIWEALRTSPIAVHTTATELCAAFAADGYARSSGRPAALLLSTGPGALNSLTGIMEAASAHVPVMAISSQIPSDMVGRGRGYLHEVTDQLACFRPLVKFAARAESAESIPGLLAQAWHEAMSPPCGPVYVEIPVDLLQAPAPADAPGTPLVIPPATRPAPPAAAAAAVELLAQAQRPVIWAGGGIIRSGAQPELRELAERLDAPVATTYMGKGALPDDHPLAAGAGCDEAALQELLRNADVLLCVGTELGAETTGQYRLQFTGRLIHLDAAPARVGASYPALPLVGDAKLTLRQLAGAVPERGNTGAAQRVQELRARIDRGLQDQGRDTEQTLLRSIEGVISADAITTWDMTILGYWAAPHLHIGEGQQFLYPLGSGTLGYAWPAALGAAVAHPHRQTLAVVGDGGLQYAVAELGTAAAYRIPAKLLVVDDGRYGILREYQLDAYGETTAVDLPGKDILAIAQAYGVPARSAIAADVGEQLEWALAQPGPAVVVLSATVAAAQPTP